MQSAALVENIIILFEMLMHVDMKWLEVHESFVLRFVVLR